MDLDTGAIVAAVIHPADQGDTTSNAGTLEAAARGRDAAGRRPHGCHAGRADRAKGDHSRAVLKALDEGPWRTRIAAQKPKDVQRWHGDRAARRAVYGPVALRRRQRSLQLRAVRVARSFAHTRARGGMRRAWRRGRENVEKRYLVHVAAYNLGLVMRTLLGAGTPRELAAKGGLLWWFFAPAAGFIVVLLPPPDPPPDPTSSTGC